MCYFSLETGWYNTDQSWSKLPLPNICLILGLLSKWKVCFSSVSAADLCGAGVCCLPQHNVMLIYNFANWKIQLYDWHLCFGTCYAITTFPIDKGEIEQICRLYTWEWSRLISNFANLLAWFAPNIFWGQIEKLFKYEMISVSNSI